jgi:hypothetical protein
MAAARIGRPAARESELVEDGIERVGRVQQGDPRAVVGIVEAFVGRVGRTARSKSHAAEEPVREGRLLHRSV